MNIDEDLIDLSEIKNQVIVFKNSIFISKFFNTFI